MAASITCFSSLVRFLAMLTLVSAMIVGGIATGPLATGPNVALADDDDDDDGGNATGGNATGGNATGGEGGQSDDEPKDKKDKGKDDPADDDQGQGNDDGPGQGQAQGQGQGQGQGGPVTRAPDYRVHVECAPIDGEARTACMFLGLVGDRVGEGDVVRVAVPEVDVCAGVVGGSVGEDAGNGKDPAVGRLLTDAVGVGEPAYVADAHVLLLVLDAEVTTVDAATYWVWNADQSLYPATGPGLQCVEQDAAAVPTEAPGTTGSLLIRVFLCEPGIVAGADIDWYGACTEPAAGASFAIEEPVVGTAGEALTGTVDDDGRLLVDDLDPGNYNVEQTDGNWCHAESDNVNDTGEVMVEADEEATIWVFDCQ